MRNTPKLVTGVADATHGRDMASDKANTRRVSAGQIKPSSHSRAVA